MLKPLIFIIFTFVCLSITNGDNDRVVIVSFKESASINDTIVTSNSAPILDGASIQSVANNVGLYIYKLDTNVSLTPQEFCNDLASDTDILLCEPDSTVSFDQTVTPNDPLFGSQWGLQATGIPEAWYQGIKGLSKVRVCDCLFINLPRLRAVFRH